MLRKLFILILLFPTALAAQSRVWHYIKTHKELLAGDALVLAALSADAASSVHCQDIRPTPCIDSSPVLGKHPSASATWGLMLGIGIGEVAGDHELVHLANEDPENYGYMRHFPWIPNIFIAGFEGPTVWNNICVAEHDQAASRQAAARLRLRGQ